MRLVNHTGMRIRVDVGTEGAKEPLYSGSLEDGEDASFDDLDVVAIRKGDPK